jgi:hemerythrin-like metal-binding protein
MEKVQITSEQTTEPIALVPEITDTAGIPFMEWKDSYRLDIATIDNQHQAIIAIINDIHAALQRSAPAVVLESAVQKLMVYAESHFDYEEQCLELCQFKELVQHRCQHRDMLKRITAFRTAIAAGQNDVYPALLEFLIDWLNRHILRSDREYAAAVRSAGMQ